MTRSAAVGDENPPGPVAARLHRRRVRDAHADADADGGRPDTGQQRRRAARQHYGAPLCFSTHPPTHFNESIIAKK